MHICHVITRLIIGGAQENTVLSCRGLIDKGHMVTLIAGPETGPEGSLWDRASQTGCRLVTVDSLRRAVRPLSDRRAGRELERCFRELQPDVVHTHSSKAGILARAAAARVHVPIIVHTIHGLSFNRTQSAFTRWFFRGLERRAARHTTAFVTVADAMTNQAVAAKIAPRERFTTVYSGMETSGFVPDGTLRSQVRAEWGVADDEVVVGTIARLFENKGYEEIIEAMPSAVAREPKLRFVWIGGGIRRSGYERRLHRLGLRNRVHLVGLIDPAAVASQLSGFDILLHASRWEGLPRAVVQGLLMAVPAISFDNDGAPEVVVPGETGILVPLGDTERLADAVVTLAVDSELRRELGQRGRVQCLERFDWRKMVDDLDRLYRRLEDRRRP